MVEARDRWAARAAAEAASADVFDALAAQLPALGLPDALAHRLRAAADDERRHAALCAALTDHAAERGLALPRRAGSDPATRAAEAITFLLAAGEALAIALLDAASAPPCADDVATTLRAIADDERRHAALGWDLLDALAAAHPAAAAGWSAVLPRMAALAAIGAEAAAPVTGDPERGVLDRATVTGVVHAALATSVAPALARRGWWAAPPGR